MNSIQLDLTGSVGRVKQIDTLAIPDVPSRARERFWANVDQSGGLFECWPWTGRIDEAGYGRFGNGSLYGTNIAHRIAWMLTNGPIPKGLDIDHVRSRGCRLRSCMNAYYHLEPVTHYENCRRGSQATQTHCVNGHAFEGDNLLWRFRRTGAPYRQCRQCTYDRARAQVRKPRRAASQNT